MENGTIVKAKALGWQETLSPEQEFDMAPFQGPIDLEGELETWEAAGRTIVTVGGFEADPDTMEPIEPAPLALSVSERARLAYKRSLGVALANDCHNDSDGRFCSGVGQSPSVPTADARSRVLNLRVVEAQAQMKKGDSTGESILHALDAIDQVHAIPSDMDKVRVFLGNNEDLRGANGNYTQAGDGFGNTEINISTSGTHPELTMVHEFGHYLDHKAHLTWDSSWSTGRTGDDLIKPLQDAIKRSPEYQVLRDISYAPDSDEEKQRVAYFMNDRETFARVYAQWVATRSGDTRMHSSIGRIISGKDSDVIWGNAHWTRENFVPIGEAMDNLFAHRDLLNKENRPSKVQ